MYIESVAKQKRMEEAHSVAFEAVVSQIEERIIILRQVIPLSELCLIYRAKLDETEFPNQIYRADNLKVC